MSRFLRWLGSVVMALAGAAAAVWAFVTRARARQGAEARALEERQRRLDEAIRSAAETRRQRRLAAEEEVRQEMREAIAKATVTPPVQASTALEEAEASEARARRELEEEDTDPDLGDATMVVRQRREPGP